MVRTLSNLLLVVLLAGLATSAACSKKQLSEPPAPWAEWNLPIGDGVIDPETAGEDGFVVRYDESTEGEPLFDAWVEPITAQGYAEVWSLAGPSAGGRIYERLFDQGDNAVKLTVTENEDDTEVSLRIEANYEPE